MTLRIKQYSLRKASFFTRFALFSNPVIYITDVQFFTLMGKPTISVSGKFILLIYSKELSILIFTVQKAVYLCTIKYIAHLYVFCCFFFPTKEAKQEHLLLLLQIHCITLCHHPGINEPLLQITGVTCSDTPPPS